MNSVFLLCTAQLSTSANPGVQPPDLNHHSGAKKVVQMDYYDTCRNCASYGTAIDTDVTVDGRNDIVFRETRSNQDYQSGQVNLINPVHRVDILFLKPKIFVTKD